MLKTLNKRFFVSPANSSLVGILTTIGDVCDIFAIPNKRPNNKEPNEHKQTKARSNKKTAESAENNIFAIKTYAMTFRHIVSGSFVRVASDVHASRE